jgi:hypothetical protein
MNDLVGKRFGNLLVIERYGSDKYNRAIWLCLCDCGNQKKINSNHLLTGNTKSCGCLYNNNNNSFKHGQCKNGKPSKTYYTWSEMNRRCTDKKHKSYKYYGGRKIKVCNRWSKNNPKGFINFLEDVGEISRGLTIDRINNNDNYYNKNCRLVTSKEQSRNKKNNINLSYNGKILCLKDYCKELNLNYNTIIKRITKGWPLEKALTTPIRKRKKII